MNQETKKKFILFGVIPAIIIMLAGVMFIIISNDSPNTETQVVESNLNALPVDSIEVQKKDSLSKREMYLKQSKQSKEKVTTGDIFGDIYSVENENDSEQVVETEEEPTPVKEDFYTYTPPAKKEYRSSGGSYKYKPKEDEYTKRLNEQFGVEDEQVTDNNQPEQDVEPEKKVRRRRVAQVNNTNTQENSQLVRCVVDNGGKSSIKNGDAIRLRLTEPMKIDNVIIPKNHIVTGIAKFNKERVTVYVNSILYKGMVYSVNYEAYDTDGLAGIYVPGGLNDELAKEGAEAGVNQATTTINVPVVGSISTTMAKKKIDEQVVKIYDNHKLVLKPVSR